MTVSPISKFKTHGEGSLVPAAGLAFSGASTRILFFIITFTPFLTLESDSNLLFSVVAVAPLFGHVFEAAHSKLVARNYWAAIGINDNSKIELQRDYFSQRLLEKYRYIAFLLAFICISFGVIFLGGATEPIEKNTIILFFSLLILEWASLFSTFSKFIAD